jgi:hypothetical protein
MTLSIKAFSIMTFSIMAFNKIVPSIMCILERMSIMTFCINDS